ncbi:MAG: sulfur carrier protein ThiS [Thermoanaerobaculia bacterium]
MSSRETAGAVRVRINGEERVLSPSMSVADLLKDLGISVPRVAVEFNREILPKRSYGETLLREDDRIEIVQFVGGG